MRHFIWFCVLFPEFLVAQNFSLSGFVYSDDEPLAFADVLIHELNKGSFTDENGFFLIENIPPAKYHIHVSKLGYKPRAFDLVLQSDTLLSISVSPTMIEMKEMLIEDHLSKSSANVLQISQYGEEEIFDRDGVSLLSKLDRIPGVSRINVGTGIDKPVVRGMSMSRLAVAENGIKQEGQQWGTDHGLEMDVFRDEKIQVVRGPSSLQYGSEAIGGVINFVAPNIPEQNKFAQELDMQAISNVGLIGASYKLEYNKKGLYTRTRISARSSADIRVPADSFIFAGYQYPLQHFSLQNTAMQERAANTSLGYAFKTGFSELSYSVIDQNIGFFPGAHGRPDATRLQADGDDRNIANPRQGVRHQKLQWRNNFKLGLNWLEFDASYQQNDRKEFEIDLQEPDLNLRLQTISSNIRLHQNNLNKGKFVHGLSFSAKNNQNLGTEFLIPDYREQSFAYYSILEKENTEKKHFKLGWRAELNHLNADEVLWSDGSLRAPDYDRLLGNASLAAGWLWMKPKGIEHRLNFASAYRFPTAAELFSNGLHHGAFRYERGDASLKTERSIQVDYQFEIHRKTWNFSLTPYTAYLDNYIYLSPSARFASNAQGGGQIHEYKQANAVMAGTEVYSDWHFSEALHLENSFEAVYGHNLAEFRPLPMIPAAQFQHRLKYEAHLFSSMEFHSLIELQNTLAQNRTERNEFATPANTLVNVQAGIKIGDALSGVWINFSIHNVLNTVYYQHLSRFRLLNLPEPGRSFNLSMKVKF